MSEPLPSLPAPTNYPGEQRSDPTQTTAVSSAGVRAVHLAGPRYGRFAIERFHAKGGLGEVLVAVDEELHRDVALKRMQERFVNEPAARRRFLNEAELTARLEHPGIVPIYGLVQDEHGHPCYAMRFIEGESLAEAIKRWHDPAKRQAFDGLPFRALLQRLISVCQTIGYAHSKNVIHRDIKPANVMLGPFGETLVVDWGLAKVLGGPPGASDDFGIDRAADTSPHPGTQAGRALGTLGYMAPEQAEGRWSDVGTHTDIFSLGATLYEMLTGERPIRGSDAYESLEKARASDFQRPRQVQPEVPAALEAICLKAMARQPQERYAAAAALSADVEQWLADERVSVYREPWPVRAGRWIRRHKVLVGSVAAAVIVLLLTFAVGGPIVAWREADLRAAATTQEKRANAEAEEARKAHAEEAAARKRAEATLNFMVEAFRRPDPSQDGKKLTVFELLGAAVKRLGTTRELDPPTRGVLLHAIGQTYLGLGEYRDVEAVFEQSRQLLQTYLGPDHPDTLANMNSLATAYQETGQLAKALPLFEDTLARRKEKLGPDDPETINSMGNLAAAYRVAGQLDKAVPLLEATLAKCNEILGPEHRDTLSCMSNLAGAYQAIGELDKAFTLLEKVQATAKEKLGAVSPEALISMNNLAHAYWKLRRLDRAVPLFEETLQLQRTKLGDDHPHTLNTQANLGVCYRDAGRTTEAISLLEDTLTKSKERPGPFPALLLDVYGTLATMYERSGDLDKEERVYRDSMEQHRTQFGTNDPRTTVPMTMLGLNLLKQKKWRDAETTLRECVAVREKIQADDWRTFSTKSTLGEALLGQKKYAEAEPFLLGGYDGMKERWERIPPQGRFRVTQALERLVRLYEEWGKAPEAAKWKKELDQFTTALPTNSK